MRKLTSGISRRRGVVATTSRSYCYTKKMWDVMTRDKLGVLRDDHNYAAWCKRIAMHSQGSTTTSNAATEHAADENAFRELAKDILTQELTPEQTNDPGYKLREGKYPSTKQRGMIKPSCGKTLEIPASKITYSSTASLFCWFRLF